MKHSRFIITITLFVVVVLLVQFWLDRGAWSVPEFQEVVMAEPCTPSAPRFQNGDLLQEDREYRIATNNLVHFLTCSAGVLSVTLRGSLLDDYGPFVVISLGKQTLWAGEVREAVAVTVTTDAAGWIGIAFTNDAYAPPQGRNLWISELSFSPATAVPDDTMN